jgi:hypothetical protein
MAIRKSDLKLLFLLILILAVPIVHAKPSPNATAQSHAIPKDIPDCIDRLKASLPKETLDDFRGRPDLGKYHMTVGMWIRNNWIYGHEKEALVQYFLKKGILQPDNMSLIILMALNRNLQSQPLQLEATLKFIRESERQQAPRVEEGKQIPVEADNILLKADSGAMRLKELKGKLVILSVLSFDDASSPEAIREINSMLQQTHSNKIVVIGIMPATPKCVSARDEFLVRNKPHFPIVKEDPPRLLTLLSEATGGNNVITIPETYVIAPSGYLQTKYNGWDTETAAALRKDISRLMK